MKHIILFENFQSNLEFLERIQKKYSIEWVYRVQKNIFESSFEKENIEDALSEWKYTKKYTRKDYETCQICGQRPINYMFKIANDLTHRTLWVGSDCIQKFSVLDIKGIKIYDDFGQQIVDDKLIRKAINDDYKKMIKDDRVLRVLNILQILMDKKPGDEYLEKIYLEYVVDNKFIPTRIPYLHKLLFRFGMLEDAPPSLFEVDIKYYSNIDLMYNELEQSDFLLIYNNYLTDEQRKKVDNRREYFKKQMAKI